MPTITPVDATESIPLPNRHALSFNMNIKKMPKATSSPSQQNGGSEIPPFISVTKFKRTLNPSDFPRVPLPVKISRVLSVILAIFSIIAIAVRLPEEKLWNYTYDMAFGGTVTPMIPMNAISLFWAATNLVFIVGLKRNLHHGFYVACDLIAWLSLLVTGLLNILMVEVIASAEPLLMAASVTTLANAALHFAVFVWACRKLDVLNKKLLTGECINVSVDMKALQMQAIHERDHYQEPVSPLYRPSDVSDVV